MSFSRKKDITISLETPLLDALRKLDANGQGVLFVTDTSDKLLGLLTDGDVRRALLKGVPINAPLSEAMNRRFHVWSDTKSREKGLLFLKKINQRELPVVNDQGQLVDVILLDDINFAHFKNSIVVMAGGVGQRLWPLTEQLPKPMLPIGGKPILEVMLERFVQQGFSQFHFCVNYMHEVIQKHFEDGSSWGVKIEYVLEPKKMGTAGAISMLADTISESFIVINGDVVTNVHLPKLLEYHANLDAVTTVCVAPYEMEVPYGVVEMKGKLVHRISEKPRQTYLVNSGIYALSPKIFSFMKKNEPLDMPELVEKMMAADQKVGAFPVHEYWADIGRLSDYEKISREAKLT